MSFKMVFRHQSGFMVVLDDRDMKRWSPDDFMPRLEPMLDRAAIVGRFKKRAISQEIRFPVKGKRDAYAIVVCFPLLRASAERGVVWIGTQKQIGEFWREMRKEGSFDRFTLMNVDPANN